MSDTKATVTSMQMAMSAKNDSVETFEFGGVTFKLLDLSYDAYIEFMEHMSPFIEQVMVPGATGTQNIKDFVKVAGKVLPRMVYLMIQKQDASLTEDWVKENAKTPYMLADLVLRQIAKNKMIEDFASFFASLTEKMQQSGLMT